MDLDELVKAPWCPVSGSVSSIGLLEIIGMPQPCAFSDAGTVDT